MDFLGEGTGGTGRGRFGKEVRKILAFDAMEYTAGGCFLRAMASGICEIIRLVMVFPGRIKEENSPEEAIIENGK